MSVHMKSITRRDALALWPDVRVCQDAANCVKRIDPPGKREHDRGVTDNWGVIHLTDLDVRVRAQGMYALCVLVALREPKIRKLPEHLRIWKSHTWAHEELKSKFHRMSRIKWSIDARIRAWRVAERAGITIDDDISFYWWCYEGRRIAMDNGNKKARSRNRSYIPDRLLQAWVADRAAGMSFGEIGKKYHRDFRSVWKALVRHGLHQPDPA